MGEFSTVRASVSAEGLAKQRVCMADFVTPECAFSTTYCKSKETPGSQQQQQQPASQPAVLASQAVPFLFPAYCQSPTSSS